MADIASIDLEKLDPIPLRCVLCPKQPSFSDVSHLLTHISSKSHLSHRFRTEIRSPKDPAARETLAEYDDWYDQYGIRHLLAERMAAKEKKTTKRPKPGTLSENPRPGPKRSKAVKTEPDTYPQEPKAEPGVYSQGPPLALWNTAAANDVFPMHGAGNEYLIDHSVYRTSGLGLPKAPYTMLGSAGKHLGPKFDRWYSETETTGSTLPSDNATDVAGEEYDRSKLKGALWPGMSVFDSATESQKRKRNQRKDASILKQMQQTSAEVEPTEIIWSEDGEFQRMRDIYASPSIDGSPEPCIDARGNRKKKGTRRGSAVPTATQPRQTRASTRKIRAKVDPKAIDKGTIGSQMGQDIRGNGCVAADMQGADDDYDIFRDPLKPSPGQFGFFVNRGPYHVSPVLTCATEGRTESPSEGGSFDPHRRPALQPMNSNMPIPPPTPRSLKPPAMPYFPGEVNTHIPPYFHHQHIGPGTLNPLSIQTRNGWPYNAFGQHNFGDDIKPEATGFHPINTSSGMAYNPFSTMADHNPFSSSSAVHQDTTDYEI